MLALICLSWRLPASAASEWCARMSVWIYLSHPLVIVIGQSLRITVNSFMADGGDGLRLLKTGRDRLGGAQDVDALIAHLQATTPTAGPARITWVD